MQRETHEPFEQPPTHPPTHSIHQTQDFGGRSKGGMEMMRHGNRVKHLGKAADQRKALLRALTTEGKERRGGGRGGGGWTGRDRM